MRDQALKLFPFRQALGDEGARFLPILDVCFKFIFLGKYLAELLAAMLYCQLIDRSGGGGLWQRCVTAGVFSKIAQSFKKVACLDFLFAARE